MGSSCRSAMARWRLGARLDVDAKGVGSAEAPTRDAVRASATSWALIVWLRKVGVEGGGRCGKV